MRETVNFDRETSRPAVEIKYERTEGMLLSKFQAFGTQPQHTPKPDFCGAQPLAQFTSSIDGHSQDPSTMLRMVPLPAQSRGGCVAPAFADSH
jgi:hypothetical protein